MKNKSILILALSFLAGGFLFSAQGLRAEVNDPKTCEECHDQAKTFAASTHGHAWSMKPEMAKTTCTKCHGDMEKHVAAGGAAAPGVVFKGKKVNAELADAQCMKCHQKTESLSNWDAGKHVKNGVTCASCHNIHGQKMVGKPTAETCFGCHKDVKNEVNKQGHHPIKEGKVNCWDCHNPHGTLNHHMIKTETVNQLCYKCHADKRGPFLWEHPPVEENCLTCHNAHGSRYDRLLKERTPQLCQSCHNIDHAKSTIDHGGTGGTSATSALGMVGRSCMNCHTNIHGSSAPAAPGGSWNGKLFFR